MLESLTRIIGDRSVGALFFGNYHLMDYELIGGDRRTAIIAEGAKNGTNAFLPPAVPFGSNQWPTLVTPSPGPASIASACCSMLGCHVPQIPRGRIGKDVAVQSLPVTKDSVRCHCVQHGGAQAIEGTLQIVSIEVDEPSVPLRRSIQ